MFVIFFVLLVGGLPIKARSQLAFSAIKLIYNLTWSMYLEVLQKEITDRVQFFLVFLYQVFMEVSFSILNY